MTERRLAVAEAARLLKPGGVVLAAGINRLAYLRDCLREWGTEVVARRDFHRQYLVDGNLDPEHAPPIGHAHLTSIDEFRAELNAFEELAFWGVESFSNTYQSSLLGLPDEAREVWLDLIEQTAGTTEGLGTSDHFLFVGRQR